LTRLEDQSTSLQKTLNESVAEKTLLDTKVDKLLNQIQIIIVNAQKVSEKYEISNNRVSQLESKMKANKSQLTESLGEYNQFVSKINNLEANETVLLNRINQYEQEKVVDREVDQNREVLKRKMESEQTEFFDRIIAMESQAIKDKVGICIYLYMDISMSIMNTYICTYVYVYICIYVYVYICQQVS
jgi:chromosome segregation ATPase